MYFNSKSLLRTAENRLVSVAHQVPSQSDGVAPKQAQIGVYPELAALMGSVPNYQGMFLRGYGSQVSTHWGTVTHASDGLGAMQGDAIRNITGEVGRTPSSDAVNGGAFYTVMNAGNGNMSGGTGIYRGFNASLVVPTANEDRPINRAVRYLIKAKS